MMSLSASGLNGAAPFMWVGMGLFWLVLIGLGILAPLRAAAGAGRTAYAGR